jgi:hypothetical protein
MSFHREGFDFIIAAIIIGRLGSLLAHDLDLIFVQFIQKYTSQG